MSIYSEIANIESILSNQPEKTHEPEEIASFKESYFRLKHIEDLWEEFGDVPMNPETECIEAPWFGFPAGTHRTTIWHWFESEFELSIAEDLMYEA